MNDVDRYIEAATRDNTRRSYRAAIEHFEVTWGGFLPATSESVARYGQPCRDAVGEYPEAALVSAGPVAYQPWLCRSHQGTDGAQGHQGHSCAAPGAGKQAEPLQLQDLEKVIARLEVEISEASAQHDQPRLLRSRRDSALILLGFWRGFRSDELCRLQVQDVKAIANSGISLYLPRSKGDRDNLGRTYQTPALQRLCPVQAYIEWINCAALVRGPVFRAVDRWGNL